MSSYQTARNEEVYLFRQKWRRGGDSNPRHPFEVKLISSQPCSATPAPLRSTLTVLNCINYKKFRFCIGDRYFCIVPDFVTTLNSHAINRSVQRLIRRMHIRHTLLDVAMPCQPCESPGVHPASTPPRQASVPKRVQHKLLLTNSAVRDSVQVRLINGIRHDMSYGRLLRRKNPTVRLFSRLLPTVLKYSTQPWGHGNDPRCCLCLCAGHN